MPAASYRKDDSCRLGVDGLRGELELLLEYKRRASYPDWMSGEYEESEKASWRQEHHLKDEEASINTTDKYKGVVSGSRDQSEGQTRVPNLLLQQLGHDLEQAT